MTVRIEAERLIPGSGDVIENGVVVFDEGEITYAGAADGADPGDAEVVKTETVMPGMWECHGHFFGIYSANIDEAHLSRPQLLSMRVTADARAALDAGFTSVREMGGLGVFLGRAVEEGVVVGPNVYGAGGTLSMTPTPTVSISTWPGPCTFVSGARTTSWTARTSVGPASAACFGLAPR